MEIKSTADFVRMTRGALTAAGFTRHEREGLVHFESGDGPSLLLVHGVNDQAGTWFGVASTLAKSHRVVIPDLPGHGESEPRTGPIALSRVVLALEQLLEPDMTVIGNSFGGWMALVLALRSRVKRLVLEASGGLNRPLAVPLVATTREDALRILRAVHGPRYDPPAWVIDALLERAHGAPLLRLTELQEHDIESRLGEIDVPTLLIHGADDGVVPMSYAHDLRAAIPNATLCVIDGAAHIPHLQQPARFLECLTSIS